MSRRGSRRLVVVALLLSLAVLAATATVVLVARSRPSAVGGPIAMNSAPSAPSIEIAPPDNAPPPGAPAPVALAVPAGPHITVPILYYHYIRTISPTPQHALGFALSISPGLFVRQMRLLHVEGAHTITLATLMAALAGKATLPPHPVVLTFDDGYADFATTAEPVLARFGFIATDFVVSGFLGGAAT